MFKFTFNEIRDLIIAFFIISLCFALLYAGRDSNVVLSILPMVMVGVGLGFILHELGHKFTSMRYGYWAEFKLWPQGLILALITSLLDLYLQLLVQFTLMETILQMKLMEKFPWLDLL